MNQGDLQELSNLFKDRMNDFEIKLQAARDNPGDNTTLFKHLSDTFLNFKTNILGMIQQFKDRLSAIEAKVDEMENYSRRNCLLFHGVPESDEENLEQVILEVIKNKLKIHNFEANMLDRLHRIGKADTKKTRPVIIKFISFKYRQFLWNAKKELKGSKFVLTESLSMTRYKLLMCARDKYGMRNTWTSNSNIIVRLANGDKHRISNYFDLNNIKSTSEEGWRQSLLALPKKWLSGTHLVHSDLGLADDSNVALPKLPVPSLEQTLLKYEKTLQPLLDEAGQIRLRKLIEKFGRPGGPGCKLQLYLLDKQQKTDNWAYKYWLNDMYLANRVPLPVNSNPGMVLPPRKFTTVLDVARFTARLLDAALTHKVILSRRALPIERATSREPGQPLCMSQYYRLLGVCRMPGKFRDSQYIPTGTCTNEHIIIICRNQFYCIPVQTNNHVRLNEGEICAQLLYILNDAPCLASTPPVGLLTSCKREQWWEARESLKKHDINCRNLELIERSTLIICLDEPLPASFNIRLPRGLKGHTTGGRDETNLALQMLHGGGTGWNSANRWFDKTVQLIISGDGACGLCYEHSAAEGVAIIQLIEQLLKHTDALPQNSEVPVPDNNQLTLPARLEWVLEPEDHKRIEDAAVHLDNIIKDLDFLVYRYGGYGKDFMKSCRVSPDVYTQLALQLAYYKLNGKLTATYESASTRRFLLGRVDCIRSATPEALEWVSAMAQPKDGDDMCGKKVTFQLVSDERKFELWQEAVKAQTKEMLDNILGQGIDIHLLGLREAAKDTSPTAATPMPEVFTDPSYLLANKFLLSTSQVSTVTDSFMGYGPVEPDGYGASYNIKPDSVLYCLSAFWSSETTSTSKFAQALEESLNSMQSFLKSKQNPN